MSVAQLKALIEEHGLSHVDCPELSGLRDRAREAIASSHQTSAGSDDRDDDESASHRESAAEEDEGPSEPPPQAPDEPTPEASEPEPAAATEDEVLGDAAFPGETTNPLVAASSAAVAKKQPATSRLSVYLSTTDKAEEPAAARQAEVDNAADVLGIRLAEKKKPSAKEKAHAEGLAKAKKEADEAKRKLAEVEAERARERYELAEAKRADAEATANAAVPAGLLEQASAGARPERGVHRAGGRRGSGSLGRRARGPRCRCCCRGPREAGARRCRARCKKKKTWWFDSTTSYL